MSVIQNVCHRMGSVVQKACHPKICRREVFVQKTVFERVLGCSFSHSFSVFPYTNLDTILVWRQFFGRQIFGRQPNFWTTDFWTKTFLEDRYYSTTDVLDDRYYSTTYFLPTDVLTTDTIWRQTFLRQIVFNNICFYANNVDWTTIVFWTTNIPRQKFIFDQFGL